MGSWSELYAWLSNNQGGPKEWQEDEVMMELLAKILTAFGLGLDIIGIFYLYFVWHKKIQVRADEIGEYLFDDVGKQMKDALYIVSAVPKAPVLLIMVGFGFQFVGVLL